MVTISPREMIFIGVCGVVFMGIGVSGLGFMRKKKVQWIERQVVPPPRIVGRETQDESCGRPGPMGNQPRGN